MRNKEKGCARHGKVGGKGEQRRGIAASVGKVETLEI